MQTLTKPDWLDEHEYPFQSHFFTTPYGDLHYVDEAPATRLSLCPAIRRGRSKRATRSNF